MVTKSLILCVLSIVLSAVLGCATHRVSVDIANDVNNHKDLLQMLGKPDLVMEHQDGCEEWAYQFKTFNILTLEYTKRNFAYLLNKNGEVIHQDLSEFMCKPRLIPWGKLPDDFKEFE